MHAYNYVLFGKTNVTIAVNTTLYQMLEGNKILIFFDLVIVLVAFLTQWDFSTMTKQPSSYSWRAV